MQLYWILFLLFPPSIYWYEQVSKFLYHVGLNIYILVETYEPSFVVSWIVLLIYKFICHFIVLLVHVAFLLLLHVKNFYFRMKILICH